MTSPALLAFKRLCLPLLFLLLSSACGGGGGGENGTTSAQSAAFTVSTASPVVGQAVLFSDASSLTATAWNWDFGDGVQSSEADPAHVYFATGHYTVTLTVTHAGGTASSTQSVQVAPQPAGSPAFSMLQTVSDGAQRTTLAFSGLALLTGNLNAQSFFPPGKVADYTGFQFLRDNDPDNMGHNTSFLTRVANNVLYILTDAQLAQLKALAGNQASQISQYGYQRFALMQVFRRLIDGSLPSGKSGISLDAVKAASRALYQIDGQISFDRALLYANLIRSLDATQKGHLDAMKGKGWNSWPNISDAQVAAKTAGLNQAAKVAVMTYAGDLYSWYAGSLDADIYFCPERHGTYYGGFYIKDAPAIGHEGYSIDEQLTATAGAALSDSSKGYVSAAQAAVMSSLVDTQRANLYRGSTNIVQLRADIASLLRGLLRSTADSDAVKARVLALSATYGDLDGENNFHSASIFAQVHGLLSAPQKTSLASRRQSILSGTYSDGTPFDFTVAASPYLYSEVIADPSVLTPYVGDTDAFFQ